MRKIFAILCLCVLVACSCATDYSRTYYPNGQVASENQIRQPYWPGYGYGGYGYYGSYPEAGYWRGYRNGGINVGPYFTNYGPRCR